MRYIFASVFVVMIMALSACSSADETKKIAKKEPVGDNKSEVNSEAWEGTGVINGNEATASNEFIEECKVKFILDGDQMIVESMDESCHTEKIELTGTYKKKDSIETEPFWGIKDQAFYISGITLGMSPAQVKAVLANPDYEGPDLGYYSWRQDYPNLSMNYGTNKTIVSINATMEKDKFKELLASSADVEQYGGDDHTLYYYGAKSSQLLILKDFNEDQEAYDLMLSSVDENFWYHVEVGSIRKVE